MPKIVHGKCVANTVAVISPGTLARQARILNVSGSSRIYVRGDGIDPAAPWTDCDVIPAAMAFIVIKLHADPDGDSEVRLVSPGAPEYSVQFLT